MTIMQILQFIRRTKIVCAEEGNLCRKYKGERLDIKMINFYCLFKIVYLLQIDDNYTDKLKLKETVKEAAYMKNYT